MTPEPRDQDLGPRPVRTWYPPGLARGPLHPLRWPLPASPDSRLLSSEVPGLVAGQLCGTCGTAPCLGFRGSCGLWVVALLFVFNRPLKPLGWLGGGVASSSLFPHHLRQVARRIGSSKTCSVGALVPCPSHEPRANKPPKYPFNVPEFSRRPLERAGSPTTRNQSRLPVDRSLTFRHPPSAALALCSGSASTGRHRAAVLRALFDCRSYDA